MALTALATFAPGDTIPSAWANLIRDNFLAIDARTGGDPGGAGKVLGSSGALAAAWTTIVALLGYTPVNKAGDTMTADLKLTSGFGVQLGPNTDDGRVYDIDGTGTIVRANAEAFRVFTSNLLAEILNVTYPSTFLFVGNTVWHSGNDGPASGLAAQTAATATSATSATTATSASNASALGGFSPGNGSSNIPISNGTVCTNLNADKLDGVDSTGFIQASPFSGPQGITCPGGAVVSFVADIAGAGGSGMQVTGDFVVTGNKARLAAGAGGETGIFHALETPLPMFEEVGRARLVGGVAVVEIPADFANYVALADGEYGVHLTAEGPAALYIADRTAESFTVRAFAGDQAATFVWRLIARQGDMGHVGRNLPLGS